MHDVFILLGFWALAFASLCSALLLLNVYSNLIGYDFTLHGPRKELALAAACSLIEAASAWGIVTYYPAAGRALILPALIVGLIYLVAHYEDWNRHDPGLVLLFQAVICGVGIALLTGNLATAVYITVAFVGALALIASIAKSL